MSSPDSCDNNVSFDLLWGEGILLVDGGGELEEWQGVLLTPSTLSHIMSSVTVA